MKRKANIRNLKGDSDSERKECYIYIASYKIFEFKKKIEVYATYAQLVLLVRGTLQPRQVPLDGIGGGLESSLPVPSHHRDFWNILKSL